MGEVRILGVPFRLNELNEHDRAERDALIADIHAAFAGVTRGRHGISWNECAALDMFESEESCEAARQSDSDQQWSELIADPDWDPFPGIGGFNFINSEGFRYYMPPTMIRFLRGDSSEWFHGHLLGVIERLVDPESRHLWSRPQLGCIARFIDFMSRHDNEVHHDSDEPNLWADAFRRYWHAELPK